MIGNINAIKIYKKICHEVDRAFDFKIEHVANN